MKYPGSPGSFYFIIFLLIFCHCSKHLRVSENTTTESSFEKLTGKNKQTIKTKQKPSILAASRRGTFAGCQSSPALIWPPSQCSVIPALLQKWLAPSFMAQRQTMREEKPETGRRPFHMAYQPRRSFRAGPSARREDSNKVRHWLVSLKAFQTEYLFPAHLQWPLCDIHRTVRHIHIYIYIYLHMINMHCFQKLCYEFHSM